VKFSLLGPLEVRDSGGQPVDLGSRRQRALLALLLLDANRVVALDRLIDGLWGEAAPPKAAASIQSYVSNLRRVLEPDRPPRSPARMLVSRVPGYALVIDRDQLDVLAFEDLVASARAASAADPHRALAELDDALALWRGAALAEFADDPFATGELARLEERRAAAEEDRIDVLLRLGQLDAAIADLGRLVEQQPLRERRQRQLVTALYLSGRQTDALDAHRRHVAHLADEFGLDPSPEFLALRDAVLRHEIALEPAPPPPARAARPYETAPAPAVELIGRDEELARFDELLDVTLRGSGGIILVSGEPGIGKTRLLEAMLERAAGRGMLTALGRCYEGGAAPAFWPFVEAARALHANADDGLAELTGRLLAAVQPERADLGGAEQVAAVMQPASRFLVADEVTAALKAIAEQCPVMIGLDDVYGADPDSLEALVRLGAMLPGVPALVVATLRTADLPADHPLAAALGELSRIPDVERIDPRPLDVEETRRLLSRESFAETDLDTASRIHRRTDGNPFFTVEMARLLRSDQSDPDREIPAGVRDVLRLRLGRLPEATQAVLRVAAVYGRTFPLDVVAAVQRAAESEALDHLEVALASQLVGEDRRTGDYRFTHVLVQQAIADTMTALRRSHLHAAVAAVLTPRAEQRPDLWVEVAHHAVEAAPVTGSEPAIEPLARAAVHAVAVNAHELAQQLVERRSAGHRHPASRSGPRRRRAARPGRSLRRPADHDGLAHPAAPGCQPAGAGARPGDRRPRCGDARAERGVVAQHRVGAVRRVPRDLPAAGRHPRADPPTGPRVPDDARDRHGAPVRRRSGRGRGGLPRGGRLPRDRRSRRRRGTADPSGGHGRRRPPRLALGARAMARRGSPTGPRRSWHEPAGSPTGTAICRRSGPCGCRA
jgi:DNA-binding SARP family transcriptional activator